MYKRDESVVQVGDPELAEIEERHRLSFEHAPTGQALIGLDGTWLAVNSALCQLFGMRAEVLQGKKAQDMIHPDELNANVARAERLMAGDITSYSTERRFVRPDGTVVWTDLHVSLARSSDGEPLHYVTHFEDVTERQLREEELRQVSEELNWANQALQENIQKAAANEVRYRALLDHLPAVAYVLDREGTILSVSGAALPPSGADEATVVGRTLAEVFLPGDALVLSSHLRSAFAGHPVSTDAILGKSRADYLVDLATMEPTWGGEPTEALMVVREITGRKDRVRAIVYAEARWRAAFVEAPVPMAEVGLDGLVLRANRALCDLLGAAAEDVEGGSLIAWLHADEQAAAAVKLAQIARRGPVESDWDQRLVGRGGSVHFVNVRASVLDGAGDSPTRLLVHLLDVTAEREQRQQVTAAHDRYSALIEHSSDLTTITDAQGTVVYASPAYEHLTGYRKEAAVGAGIPDMAHPADVERVQQALASVAEVTDAVARFGCRIRHADGGWRHVEMVVANRLHDPAVGGLVANARDVTESVEAVNRLAHQAMHDSLTNLPNRSLVLRHLRDALSRANASGHPCALLVVDLDHFKNVNDSFGHAAGDHLLIELAGRLQQVTRAGDVVARLGGDEFVVLAENVGGARGAVDIAERIRTGTREPLQLAGHTVTIGCSVGIALATTHDAEALLQEADTALFQAKERGRNRWELYDDAMRTQARRRLDTESLIRANLQGDGPLVLYQPIVDLRTGQVSSTEALARLADPGGRLLGAAEF
ncbi:MAG: PAS domain S-box protein, partial [Acidimicrobiaceae bacterium]|nr:PAS domain S-box protein [Acidimicrobiaceae bacterium]